MKTFIQILGMLCIAAAAQAQVAWTEPAQINFNNPVKLYVDLDETTCPNLGLGDVYLWTWKPSENLASGGNGMWDNSNEAHKMTAEGNNVFSITFTPTLQAFYNVTPQVAITNGFAFLIKRKSGNTGGVCSGEAKTEDIILPIVAVTTKEVLPESSIRFFPNPVTAGQINLEIKDNELTGQTMEAIIVDLSGRTVLQQSFTGNSIDVTNIANGQYVLQINTEKGVWAKTFVKK
ncbi:MAG: T9SS type A sorting domain-containing protein [Saprospiraceae bacterium]|nr:T9SS type A sorting domain-containing protein [Saprospiraceae bacterium]